VLIPQAVLYIVESEDTTSAGRGLNTGHITGFAPGIMHNTVLIRHKHLPESGLDAEEVYPDQGL
jgi:hypothetical protein